MDTLKARLEAVEDRIVKAAARSGRKRGDIRLIAVTKVFPHEVIEEAYALGLRDFGENYVQEFEGKFPFVSHLESARFHLIGHLQSNKARRAAELFHCIQTVDTPKLAERLDQTGTPLDIMLEVKLSEEQAKSGAAPEDLPALVDAVRHTRHLRLIGLMTMPPWSDDPELSRPYFTSLRELGRKLGLERLSMGMSHDLEAAIEEGATDVRVGTALFGPRRKKT